MDPPSALYTPAIQLKSVVLPAPLGPMSPTISPSFTDRVTLSLATRPPNRLVRLTTSSSAISCIAPDPASGKHCPGSVRAQARYPPFLCRIARPVIGTECLSDLDLLLVSKLLKKAVRAKLLRHVA